ncbi:unnamed protein product [Fusarium graminearum]|nr:unnamed protein product [Fusarium graminearum]
MPGGSVTGSQVKQFHVLVARLQGTSAIRQRFGDMFKFEKGYFKSTRNVHVLNLIHLALYDLWKKATSSLLYEEKKDPDHGTKVKHIFQAGRYSLRHPI